jgi:hypothetical protein
VENSLWKRLWTSRETDYGTNAGIPWHTYGIVRLFIEKNCGMCDSFEETGGFDSPHNILTIAMCLQAELECVCVCVDVGRMRPASCS